MTPAPGLLWLVGGGLFPLTVVVGFLGWPAWMAWAAFALLCLVAGVDAWASRQRLDAVRAAWPEEVRAFRGRPETVALRVESAVALGRVVVGVPWPDSFVGAEEMRAVTLGAGEQEMSFVVAPARRGEHRLDGVRMETRSMLGLWEVRRHVPGDCVIRVYPNVRASEGVKALAKQAGQRALRQMGKGREFEKLREYVPGDGLDEIHWKATARRNQPITKVFQIERTQEVYVVVDASRLSARLVEGEPALDRTLESALVLGLAAERHGDLFGLVAFSDRIHGFVRARNGKAHYAACRDAIYKLEPQASPADFDELFAFLHARLRRRALLIVLTALDDPALAESFARSSRLLARRHVVVAGMIQPPGTAPLLTEPAADESEVYQRLGGHLAWRALRQVELELERQGVRFRLFAPREFTGGLVSLYDEIKQRQLL